MTSHINLRKGKWSEEEERYADRLIAEFTEGTVEGASGKSLRCFLADRLQCDPMRISKKYASKKIGKITFVPNMSDEKIKDSRQLTRLKEAFHRSLDATNMIDAASIPSSVTGGGGGGGGVGGTCNPFLQEGEMLCREMPFSTTAYNSNNTAVAAVVQEENIKHEKYTSKGMNEINKLSNSDAYIQVADPGLPSYLWTVEKEAKCDHNLVPQKRKHALSKITPDQYALMAKEAVEAVIKLDRSNSNSTTTNAAATTAMRNNQPLHDMNQTKKIMTAAAVVSLSSSSTPSR